MSPMRLVRITAMTAPAAPMSIARAEMTATLLVTGRYSGGAWSASRAGSRDGATGSPSSSAIWVGLRSATSCVFLVFEFTDHGRRREIDLRRAQPVLEQIGEFRLFVGCHVREAVDQLHRDRRRRVGQLVATGRRKIDLGATLVGGR